MSDTAMGRISRFLYRHFRWPLTLLGLFLWWLINEMAGNWASDVASKSLSHLFPVNEGDLTAWIIGRAAYLLAAAAIVVIVYHFSAQRARQATGGSGKTMTALTAGLPYGTLEKPRTLEGLWDLRKNGVKIRNEEITLDGLDEWDIRATQWFQDVYAEAGKVSLTLRSWLETLNTTRPIPANIHPVSGHHELRVRCMNEVLARLDEYLKGKL